MSAGNLEAAWSQWDGPGLEHLRLRAGESGVEADGVVVGEEDGTCFRARYIIHCNPRWRTRELIVDPLNGSDPLRLNSDGENDWRDASGRALPELRGCIDVDLSVTPFTNTLPIRRLDLREGESSEIAGYFEATVHVSRAQPRWRPLQVRRRGAVPGVHG
jgi:hypothetical protein